MDKTVFPYQPVPERVETVGFGETAPTPTLDEYDCGITCECGHYVHGGACVANCACPLRAVF